MTLSKTGLLEKNNVCSKRVTVVVELVNKCEEVASPKIKLS